MVANAGRAAALAPSRGIRRRVGRRRRRPGARDRRGGLCPCRVAVAARHVGADVVAAGAGADIGDPRRLGLELQHARVAGFSRHEPRYRLVRVGATAQRQEGPRPEKARARVVRVERERLRGRAQRVGGAAEVELRAGRVREARHGELAVVPPGRGRSRPESRGRRRLAAPEGGVAAFLEGFRRLDLVGSPDGCRLLWGCWQQAIVPEEIDPDLDHRFLVSYLKHDGRAGSLLVGQPIG